MASQDQTICVRRANGFCQLCWVAAAKTDVQVSGDAPSMGILDVSITKYAQKTYFQNVSLGLEMLFQLTSRMIIN